MAAGCGVTGSCGWSGRLLMRSSGGAGGRGTANVPDGTRRRVRDGHASTAGGNRPGTPSLWRRGLSHPGLDALHAAARALAAAGWLHRPPGSWLPGPEAMVLRG
ncbi:hypothetical protein TPA0910_23240 [Streptomyces hygroscopicus subsp. sporocinereus]|uniref:Uncharacterized protein n=1 Tax=Streptomyces hygroscopicus TaxID=1912 RepID=A0ABQ3TY32_STRHY|nr:hypothetical protein TPA0910_23240 [Streptomyces hygroscopicus]